MHVCVAIVGYHSPLIYSYMALVIKRQYLGVSHDKLATISTRKVWCNVMSYRQSTQSVFAS